MESRRVSPATSKVAAAPFRCAAVVTDIEGTTGSIAFVRDVLFPYAQQHLAAFVAQHRGDPAVARLLRDAAEAAGEPELADDRVVALLQRWITEDRKVTPLKTLQGLIWAAGYAGGELQGHVYPDAAAGLRRWQAAGLALFVYSSGSVAAQKLQFGHSRRSHPALSRLLRYDGRPEGGSRFLPPHRGRHRPRARADPVPVG
jgi:2,3-diketo-5-methylthio-1-phosphopentane phosphatase